MKIKKKPVKPERQKVEKFIYLENYSTLKEVLDDIQNRGLDPENICIKFDYDNVYFVYYTDESDKTYNIVLKNYEIQLVKWQKWYDENKEEIELQLKKEKTKKLERLEKEKKRIQALIDKEKNGNSL